MSKKATEEELSELHGEFARTLKSFLQRSKRIVENAEDEQDVEPNASLLNVVKGFLKDNGIEADAGPGGKGDFDQLVGGLESMPYQDKGSTTEPH